MPFDINIIYFLWYKQKSVNQFSLSKLIFFLKQPLCLFETFENQLMTLYCQVKVRTIMISVIDGLFVLLYFANGFSTLVISGDKRHLYVIFVNSVFYFDFDCGVCYCIFKLNRHPFFRSYKYHWFSGTGLRFLKSSFFFFISQCQ